MKVKKMIWVGLLWPKRSASDRLKVAVFNKEEEADEFGPLMFLGQKEDANFFLAYFSSREQYLLAKIVCVKVHLLKSERFLEVQFRYDEETEDNFLEATRALLEEGWIFEGEVDYTKKQ